MSDGLFLLQPKQTWNFIIAYMVNDSDVEVLLFS